MTLSSVIEVVLENAHNFSTTRVSLLVEMKKIVSIKFTPIIVIK